MMSHNMQVHPGVKLFIALAVAHKHEYTCKSALKVRKRFPEVVVATEYEFVGWYRSLV